MTAMSSTYYGTVKASPCHRNLNYDHFSSKPPRQTAEGGKTTSRMFVREARERQQEAEIEQKLNNIETRMQDRQLQKRLKLRDKSDMLRARNTSNQNRLDQQRYEEVLKNDKKRERLER